MQLTLDEAARLFRPKGFEGTSMRDIASAVGMLAGSLYCQFASEDALLAAVASERRRSAHHRGHVRA